MKCLPINGVRHIAHTSHSTSQLHIATKFHFLRVNTVSRLLLLSLLDDMVPQLLPDMDFDFKLGLVLSVEGSFWGVWVVVSGMVDAVVNNVVSVDSVANNVDSFEILQCHENV